MTTGTSLRPVGGSDPLTGDGPRRPRHGGITGWRRLPPLGQDAILTALAWLCVVALPPLDVLTKPDGRPAAEPVTLSGIALHLVVATLLCAPLLARRRFPILSTAAIGAVMVLAVVFKIPLFLGGLPVLVGFGAATSAAYYRTGRWRLLLAVIIAACTLASRTGAERLPAASEIFMLAAMTLLPITLGWMLRLQRDRARELIRLREATHRQRRAEDRTRVAREVHDSVGHHLSSIRLRAVGALAERSTPADEPLRSIAETSAVAIGEIRRLLDLLRNDDPAPPVPVAELRALARDVSDRHRTVAVLVDQTCPDSVPHDAFRVVQESVTNVIRHSGARTASIGLTCEQGTLVITVDDDGSARPGTKINSGFGLPGMAQRVHRGGGTFVAGPRSPHGWSVRATFPTGTAP